MNTDICMYIHISSMYIIYMLVSILHRIIKRSGKGIAATDDAGRSEEGACNLHRQISIRKNA